MSRLSDIPSAAEPAPGAQPSAIVARIRAIRPGRRAVLRALVVGAAAAALVPLDWYLTRREAGAAGQNRTEHMSCEEGGYDEESNNWPDGGTAMCVGGFRRGTFPCSGGWHREGSYSHGNEAIESTRLASECNGRNAWRWKGVRCSDAVTTVTWDDGDEYTGSTIAVCAV